MRVHPRAVVLNSGFGMNVTVLPAFHAVFLTTYLYFSTLSAVFSSVSKRMSISAWPAVPTSWWCTSILMPTCSRFSTIWLRRSWYWSMGGSGK